MTDILSEYMDAIQDRVADMVIQAQQEVASIAAEISSQSGFQQSRFQSVDGRLLMAMAPQRASGLKHQFDCHIDSFWSFGTLRENR